MATDSGNHRLYESFTRAFLRHGRTVTFDPKAEVFVNDDEANRMRTGAKRAPWKA